MRPQADKINNIMKKLLVEFIGSLVISTVLVIAAMQNSWMELSFAVGFVYMAMVYTGGHISGGHFNPAVSLAVFLRGRMSMRDLPGFVLVQFLGAALGAGLGSLCVTTKQSTGIVLNADIVAAMATELLGTFVLCFVFLNVASSRTTIGNSFYGLALGGMMVGCMLTFGKISGGAFNPALGLSLGISNISGFGNIWVHWVAEVTGSVAAAFCFVFIHGKEN
ncbi:MAG: aquaporin [Saprospiraceae bacterium]|nr:aquaporin [Saprospiraceae bacterium]MBK9632805.1 aquaporin [Saprospiraceae bacterium]